MTEWAGSKADAKPNAGIIGELLEINDRVEAILTRLVAASREGKCLHINHKDLRTMGTAPTYQQMCMDCGATREVPVDAESVQEKGGA